MPSQLINHTHLRLPLVIAIALLLMAGTACSTDKYEPRIEDFPALLLGRWESQTGLVGTITFEGTDASGVAIRSADGVQAESFTWLWVAPATVRTNLGPDEDIEFTVLFENGGDTLVLATAPAAETDEILRYSRVK